MEQKHLLPCPVCGSTDVKVADNGATIYYCVVMCKDCQISGPANIREQDAIREWNELPRCFTRYDPSPYFQNGGISIENKAFFFDGIDRWITTNVTPQEKVCSHCGVSNPPNHVLCLACGAVLV